MNLNLVEWNPLREFSTLHNRLDRFFGAGFFPTVKFYSDPDFGSWRPAVDIYDHDDKVVMKAELPGVDKKDIEIDIKDGVLTLKGERAYEKEVKEDSYYRKERAFGKFTRVFTLPSDLDPDKISAEFKDGVLRIEVPKPEKKIPKKISIH